MGEGVKIVKKSHNSKIIMLAFNILSKYPKKKE
jgi:hypothetical protein